MSNNVLLNNVDHRNLRVEAGYGASLGDNVMCALTFPGEFRNVQGHYPIVFHREAAGGFRPLVLLGLQDGDNLSWTARAGMPPTCRCRSGASRS